MISEKSIKKYVNQRIDPRRGLWGGSLKKQLIKIESGKVTPKYENMEFLLRQINMSFEEFDYIYHLYQPSQRTEIMQTLSQYELNPRD